MNVLIEAAQTLEKGAAILEERGWCQGTNLDEANRLCVFGALAVAMDQDASDDYDGITWTGPKAPAMNQAMVGSMLDVIGTPLDVEINDQAASGISSRWNDMPGRTAEEVTTTMRSAAQRLYERDRT